MAGLVAGIAKGTPVKSLASELGKSEGVIRSTLIQVKSDLHQALLPATPRHAALWEVEEEAWLRRSFAAGVDLQGLVRQVGRTSNAVLGRLRNMGVVTLVGDTLLNAHTSFI